MTLECKLEATGKTTITFKCERIDGRVTRGVQNWELKTVPIIGEAFNSLQSDFGEFKYIYIVKGNANIDEMNNIIDATMLWWRAATALFFTWHQKKLDGVTSWPEDSGLNIAAGMWWNKVRCNILSLDCHEDGEAPGLFEYTMVLLRGVRFPI